MRLAGIAACVPPGRVPNDPKVAAATGIPARRVAADDVSGLDLCLAAARRVLADTGARPEEFGAILAVSFTQLQRMPCLAAQAQARLGFPKDILAFDVLQACAGWGYGLYLAALLVRETGKKVLLLDGDKQSAFLDATDPATAPLLSDGGTATVVGGGRKKEEGRRKREEGSGEEDGLEWRFAFLTDGAKGGALKLEKDGTIEMDGFGVFRFVATDVVAFLKDFLSSLPPSRPSTPVPSSLFPVPSSLFPVPSSLFPVPSSFFFVPHQPNVYLVRQLAKAVGLADRVLISADRFGNLSSASVPTTLAAHAETLLATSEPPRVLISGFGGGLAISAGLIDLPHDCKLAVIA